jgi:ABC-type dipeptide/oligopeptide/nickel transport system permease component
MKKSIATFVMIALIMFLSGCGKKSDIIAKIAAGEIIENPILSVPIRKYLGLIKPFYNQLMMFPNNLLHYLKLPHK